jgi:DNA-binding transcriptional MocR family regulator
MSAKYLALWILEYGEYLMRVEDIARALNVSRAEVFSNARQLRKSGFLDAREPSLLLCSHEVAQEIKNETKLFAHYRKMGWPVPVKEKEPPAVAVEVKPPEPKEKSVPLKKPTKSTITTKKSIGGGV